MKEMLIVVYKRPDTYKGYSKINHYHIPTKIECFFVDHTDERNMNITRDGEIWEDEYKFRTYNYKDSVIGVYSYTDRNEANKVLKNVMSWESGWVRKIYKA